MTDEEIALADVLRTLMAYAVIGQAAYIGMFLSGILCIIALIAPLGFSPMFGFITVPLVCLWLGWKAAKR